MLAISRGTIHWDADPRVPGPSSLQAVVLLTDVTRDEGGFQCLPEVYKNLDAWLEQYASGEGFDSSEPGLNHWKTTQVEGKTGDVILWSTKLPHGTATNLSNRPRIAAFVTNAASRRLRATSRVVDDLVADKTSPDYWRGLPGQVDPEPGVPAVLSELGLKLIGVLPW